MEGGIMDAIVTSPVPQRHQVIITKAKAYMEEHFQENISLHEIACYCGVSTFHFSRLFKQFTSYSPYQYLLHVRLSHAKKLLRSTDDPITDICFSSGFNGLEHFATIFKHKFQQNPSEYRKQATQVAIR